MSESEETTVPPSRLLVRGRTEILAFIGPASFTPEPPSTVAIVPNPESGLDKNREIRLAPLYSPLGDICCLTGRSCSIYEAINGTCLAEVPTSEEIAYAEFSPLGTYLVTWSRPAPGSTGGVSEGTEGNQKIWYIPRTPYSATEPSALTGTIDLVISFHQKTYKRHSIQWTADEQLCMRAVSNEVHIWRGNDFSAGVIGKVRHKGITQFKVSPASSPASIGVFVPESGGKAAMTTLYSYSESMGEEAESIGSRTMFSASEASMHWNTQGTSLLIHTHSDVDKSNTSYYGSTGLFILTTDGTSEMVPRSKDGPIYDVSWSPLGDKFVVAAGQMPAQCTLYDEKGKAIFEFGSAHRNTISWSPHGRFLAITGFGNLAGEMDFYDMLRGKPKKIGSNESHCAVSHCWSPDSRYFLTATLAPRVNVDNGLKIFKYNGAGPVIDLPLDVAYNVLWQPAAPGVYKSRGQSPKREGSEASVSTKPTIAKAQPYRPPGSSGAFADSLRRATGPTGKVTDPLAKAAPSGGKSTTTAAPVKPVRVIPGMPPPSAVPTVVKKDKKPKKEASKAAALVPTPPPLPTPPPPPVEKDVSDMTPEEKEKKAKTIRKKLKALEDLKVKVAAGVKMNADQAEKLGSETGLLADLAALGI